MNAPVQRNVIFASGVWVAEVSNGYEFKEVSRGTADNEEEAVSTANAALDAFLGVSEEADEISKSQAWGAALVRKYEVRMLKDGINDDEDAALALDRFLREASLLLMLGRLHIAYAAVRVLINTPERDRPPQATNEILIAIYNEIAERIQREPWK
jgi:hypothetical protein